MSLLGEDYEVTHLIFDMKIIFHMIGNFQEIFWKEKFARGGSRFTYLKNV